MQSVRSALIVVGASLAVLAALVSLASRAQMEPLIYVAGESPKARSVVYVYAYRGYGSEWVPTFERYGPHGEEAQMVAYIHLATPIPPGTPGKGGDPFADFAAGIEAVKRAGVTTFLPFNEELAGQLRLRELLHMSKPCPRRGTEPPRPRQTVLARDSPTSVGESFCINQPL